MAEKGRKRKSIFERAVANKRKEEERNKSRVIIGTAAFERWRQLKHQKGLQTDAMVALFLLDRYDASASPTNSSKTQHRRDDIARERLDFHEEEERMSSIEIVVDIDEDDFTYNPDSDIDEADYWLRSPTEDTGSVSEEDSLHESEDTDYTPSSHVQTNGTINTKTSLNAVQSISKEDTEGTAHDTTDKEMVQRSSAPQKIMPHHQLGNQENDPAENLQQKKEHFKKICSAEQPSWPSGIHSICPQSELRLDPPAQHNSMSTQMHVNKAASEVNHHEEHTPETQDQNRSTGPPGKTHLEPTSKHRSSHFNYLVKQPEEPEQNKGPQSSKSNSICPTCGNAFSQNQGLK